MYVIDNAKPGAPGAGIERDASTRPTTKDVVLARAFVDSLRTGTSTSYQRLALRCELAAQGYSSIYVTPRHRQLFEAAGIPWRDGANLDAELRAITRAQAGDLLRRLKGSA